MASLTNVLPPSAASRSSNLLVPTSQPVPLLGTPLAQGYGYACVAGVLIYYYLRAGALVDNPLPTLLQDILPIAVFQSLFCMICLPIAGTWHSGTVDAGKGGKGSDSSSTTARKAAGVSGNTSVRRRVGVPGTPSKGPGSSRSTSEAAAAGPWQSRIMPTILSLILTVTVPPVPLAVLALVLGAPLYPTSLIPHTFVLAIHVALLGFLPIFYTHGVSTMAWRDVAAAWLPFDEAGVWGGAVGTMVGGWIGAIPIALDWDREWQKWPCTVVWGAVLGWSMGRLLTSALRLGIGSRINFSASRAQHEHPAALEESDAGSDDKNK